MSEPKYYYHIHWTEHINEETYNALTPLGKRFYTDDPDKYFKTVDRSRYRNWVIKNANARFERLAKENEERRKIAWEIAQYLPKPTTQKVTCKSNSDNTLWVLCMIVSLFALFISIILLR